MINEEEEKEGYEQVIEIEYFDELSKLRRSNQFSVFILDFLIEKISNYDNLKDKYSFEVIEYGFLSEYPAIGVQHLTDDGHGIDLYEYINEKFESIIKEISFKEFIDYTLSKNDHLKDTLRYWQENTIVDDLNW